MGCRGPFTSGAESFEERKKGIPKSAQKFKPYFQAHTIIVLTDKPLKRAMSSLEAAGQMALWEVELSEFDIWYYPHTTTKGQVVADFITEFTPMEG